MLKRCLRCDKCLVNDEQNFLQYYDDGKTMPFEEKPVDILKLPVSTIYSNELRKHQNFYNFYSSELCVDDFFRKC